MPTVNEIQIGGSHYKNGGVQHWDLIDDYGVGYLEANATKYLARWRKKDGLRDLEKCEHYLRKLYDKRSGLSHSEQVSRMPRVPSGEIANFARQQDLTAEEELILSYILRWESTATIDLSRRAVQALIARNTPADEPGPGYVDQDR